MRTASRFTRQQAERVRARCAALRTPDGRASKPHGMAWIMAKLRRIILRHR